MLFPSEFTRRFMISLLRITGYDQAMRLFASAWPTHVVSVLVGDVPRYGYKPMS
jgi:hypothetical protein